MTDLAHIQQQTKFKILLIGDNCLDQYHYGICERISPEAPVPIIKVIETITVPGMAANVKKNLENLNIDCNFITNAETILKTRYIDRKSGQHMLRVDTEPYIEPCNNIFFDQCYNAIVISDYNKGFLSYQTITQIIDRYVCPIFIDTKKTDLAQFSRPNVYVKINETEYKNSVSKSTNLIVTLGDRGARLQSNNMEKLFPTQPREVVDVCGCGDTFLSALVFSYLQTQDISRAIIFANKASSITVQHQGNYAPCLEEILNA